MAYRSPAFFLPLWHRPRGVCHILLALLIEPIPLRIKPNLRIIRRRPIFSNDPGG